MAAFMGTKGTITIATPQILLPSTLLLYASRWTMNITRTVAEATAFSPLGNQKLFIGGTWTAEGTAEGFSDTTAGIIHTTAGAAAAATQGAFIFDSAFGAFVLSTALGQSYTFDGIITSWSETSEVDQLVKWQLAFQASAGGTTATNFVVAGV